MEYIGNNKALVDAFAEAIRIAVGNLDFDVRCIDWFSYRPDYYRKIAGKAQMAEHLLGKQEEASSILAAGSRLKQDSNVAAVAF